MSDRPERYQSIILFSLFIVACLIRLSLSGAIPSIGDSLIIFSPFYGWEESDYGNLAMVQGVYDSGFTAFDMNHMPGFYAFGAMLLFFTDDTVIAAKSVSFIGGMISYGLTVFLARQISGFHVAFWVAFLLMFQPEFTLYSASALREPLYSAFLLGLLYALLKKKPWLALAMSLLAFSVRFESPLACLPVLALVFFKNERKSALFAMIGFGLAGLTWSIYCWFVYENPQFWSHAAAVNVETGLGAEATSSLDWIKNGLIVSWSLLFELMPSRMGWFIFLGWLVAPFAVDRNSNLIYPLVLSYGLVFVWLLIAFVSQHDPAHNLYWKWLMPFVPLVTWVGIAAFALVMLKVPRGIQYLGFGVMAIQASASHAIELNRQNKRAYRLYKPQVDLAKKIECSALLDRPYIIDNIPACWIRRRPTDIEMISWFDVGFNSDDPSDFAQWVVDRNVSGILWFKEEWTQAPLKTPFLSEGNTWSHDGLVLEPTSKDLDPNGYGWIFYERVDGDFKPLPDCH